MKQTCSLNKIKMVLIISYLTLVTVCFSYVNSDKFKFYEQKHHHSAKLLNDGNVKAIAALSDEGHFTSVLNQILIPRVVGTPNHDKVYSFIVTSLQELGWDVETDEFLDKTPLHKNKLKFRNIIATLNPNADRYLVLACHYDSKYTREHVFVGATDSAVPCAMMINLAKVMQKQLNTLKSSPLSLMLIFFDGEEAFREWGPNDSLYGARHLARKWQNSAHKEGTKLHRMDVMVLLDLLGAPDPVFYSFFRSTEKWYVRLATAESKLAELGELQNYSTGREEQTYFRLRSSGDSIQDDHVPFLQRNVDILHLIPTPFPSIWHTARDDLSALDFKTIENLNKILRVFVAEYLHLDP